MGAIMASAGSLQTHYPTKLPITKGLRLLWRWPDLIDLDGGLIRSNYLIESPRFLVLIESHPV